MNNYDNEEYNMWCEYMDDLESARSADGDDYEPLDAWDTLTVGQLAGAVSYA